MWLLMDRLAVCGRPLARSSLPAPQGRGHGLWQTRDPGAFATAVRPTSQEANTHPKNNNGAWSVADPRLPDGPEERSLPSANDRLIAIIRALDGTWHRPFTTLELAALQGLIEPEAHLELDGLSDSAWRERIGNAVPPPAAEAIASVMAMSLLLAEAGETFVLRNEPIWVRPIAAGISLAQGVG